MENYFHRVNRLSNTRFWINNPTMEEAALAIAEGAVGCTTNPAYSLKMIKSDKKSGLYRGMMKKALDKTGSPGNAAAVVQRNMVSKLAEIFYAKYEKNPDKEGFVSIQGDPREDIDADLIIKDALENLKLGRNIIAKIPVTPAGIEAIIYLAGKNVPVIATEIMAISQALAVCEGYTAVCKRTGVYPPMYVTHITGIFDEYLKGVVSEKQIDISSDLLWLAGVIVARRQYKILKERGYNIVMLGGGARDLHHFTEFVGGDMHITINWEGTAKELIEKNPPVVFRMDADIPEYAAGELCSKLPDFAKAYEPDGLDRSEFAGFGPVQLFRNRFIAGWDGLADAILKV